MIELYCPHAELQDDSGEVALLLQVSESTDIKVEHVFALFLECIIAN